MKHNRQGFTLIELLIVVAFGSILIAIAVPSVMSSVGSSRLEASARTLATEINMARTLAVSRNTTYEISLRGQAIQVIDPSDTDAAPRTEKLFETGVTCSGVPAEPIRFFPRGHARPGVITLSNGLGQSVSVRVRRSGMVEVEDFLYEEQ